jgi:hypothetical protein
MGLTIAHTPFRNNCEASDEFLAENNLIAHAVESLK